LKTKTIQVEPLRNLDKKVNLAKRQIADFYQKRFPAQDSPIVAEFGKLAAANGVLIEQVKYPVRDEETDRLYPVEIEANLSGSYVSLARFINALERDDMFFIISSITLGSEQKGPIRLQMKVGTYLKAGA
jgi:type IV pilus assembly protein PilO